MAIDLQKIAAMPGIGRSKEALDDALAQERETKESEIWRVTQIVTVRAQTLDEAIQAFEAGHWRSEAVMTFEPLRITK